MLSPEMEAAVAQLRATQETARSTTAALRDAEKASNDAPLDMAAAREAFAAAIVAGSAAAAAVQAELELVRLRFKEFRDGFDRLSREILGDA